MGSRFRLKADLLVPPTGGQVPNPQQKSMRRKIDATIVVIQSRLSFCGFDVETQSQRHTLSESTLIFDATQLAIFTFVR